WGQARTVFPDSLQGVLLLASVLLLLCAPPKRVALGGLTLGLAILVKLTSLLFVPALLLLPDASGRPLWRRPIAALGVVGPSMIALAIHGVYNLLRFGDPLTTAYYSTDGAGGGLDFNGNLWVGLYGLLLSPGRGLVWYAPPVLLAGLALPRLYRQRTTVCKALLALVVLWLLVHARWADWHAGWGWGPRYLLPILPLALVPIAAIWRDMTRDRKSTRLNSSH